jgi:hypothetical protein
MTEQQQNSEGPGNIPPEVLKSALKAFKKGPSLPPSMTIHDSDEGRFRAAMRAFTPSSRQASFLARCGRSFVSKANSVIQGTDSMNSQHLNPTRYRLITPAVFC